MTEGARILSITSKHPDLQKRETQETNPSHLEVVVDTGLKSGRLTIVSVDLAESLRLAAQLSTSIQNVVRARGIE